MLQNDNGDTLKLNSGSNFNFATKLDNDLYYNVTVQTQPNNPIQTCSVTSGGSGQMPAADISSVNVNCVTRCRVETVSGVSTDNTGVNGFYEAFDSLTVGPSFNVESDASLFFPVVWKFFSCPVLLLSMTPR